MFWSAHEALSVVRAIDRRETYRFLNSAIDSSVTRKALGVGLALSHSNSTNRRTDLVLHSSSRAASAMVLVSPYARARSSCAKRWNPLYGTSHPATVPSALPTTGNSLDNPLAISTAAQQIVAEIGATAAAFPSAKNLVSWVGACPGEEESAGVNYSKRSPKGNRQMRRILNQAANAAVKRKGSIFEILYRRLVPRLGHNKTIGAIPHRACAS